MAESQNRDTVKKYVGDMIALESHIEEALDHQVDKVTEPADAVAAVRRFHTMVKSQRDALKSHLQSMGGEEGSPIKTAVSTVAGVTAGIIDKVRPEALSKALRDDVTAFTHAATAYHMLHGTALMLGEQATADLAERHHRAYADAVQDINQMVLNVVALELEKDGHKINRSVVQKATQDMNRNWQQTTPAEAKR